MNSRKVTAEKLRRKGYLYSEIAKELGVSKSSAHLWTKGLVLTDGEKILVSKKLAISQRDKISNLRLLNKARYTEQSAIVQKEVAETLTKTQINTNHKKLLCAVLFWCEGGKDVSSGVRFMNSDPLMIETFLTLLRDAFEIKEEKLRALVHLHSYHNSQKQLHYWSKVTKIPITQFYKPYS